jgi:hypothetical protein
MPRRTAPSTGRSAKPRPRWAPCSLRPGAAIAAVGDGRGTESRLGHHLVRKSVATGQGHMRSWERRRERGRIMPAAPSGRTWRPAWSCPAAPAPARPRTSSLHLLTLVQPLRAALTCPARYCDRPSSGSIATASFAAASARLSCAGAGPLATPPPAHSGPHFASESARARGASHTKHNQG